MHSVEEHMKINLPEFNECVLCGRCLQVCPLFGAENREELSPRAKGLFLRDLVRRESMPRKAERLAGLCLSCGRCKKACPQDLDMPEIISRVKSATPSWQKFVWQKANKSLPVLLPFMSRAENAKCLPETARPYVRAVSRPRPEPFLNAVPDNALEGTTCVLFPGCLTTYSWTWLEETAATLLGNRGAEIRTRPNWSCCGYSLFSAGARDAARKCMQKNIALWNDLGRPRIVTFCATCHQGLKLARNPGPEEDAKICSAFLNSIDYMPDLMHGTRVEASGPSPERIFWHLPCHAPDTEFSLRASMKTVKNEVHLSRYACCGLGGSMLLEDKNSCLKVNENFWNQAGAASAEAVITECSGCVLQLEATKPGGKTVYHWLEIFSG